VAEALEIQEIHKEFLREAGFNLTNLRTQVQLMYWSEQHFITQGLLELLPFGEILSDIHFYSYVDYSLDELISKAKQTLLYWRLLGIIQYDGTPVTQLSLFYNETFLCVMVRSPCLSVVLVLEFSDRGISQIGSQPDVSIRKSS